MLSSQCQDIREARAGQPAWTRLAGHPSRATAHPVTAATHLSLLVWGGGCVPSRCHPWWRPIRSHYYFQAAFLRQDEGPPRTPRHILHPEPRAQQPHCTHTLITSLSRPERPPNSVKTSHSGELLVPPPKSGISGGSVPTHGAWAPGKAFLPTQLSPRGGLGG